MRPYTYDDSPDVLEDGEWVQDGYTMRWVPADRRFHGSLFEPACPCGALPTDPCFTPDGKPRKSHPVRTTPRVCRCGVEARPGGTRCGGCRGAA